MRGRLGGVHLTPVGRRALLVETDDATQALALAARVRELVRAGELNLQEVVPAAGSVLLDGVDDPGQVRELLAGWTPGTETPPGELVEIGVEYDGADLADVAERWGQSVEEVIESHTRMEFVAAFCGFAPGFAYLSGLPARLHVPRLDSPRPRVPAGAVAVAGEWCAVYPTASPGGWRILGRTTTVLWDQERARPALLVPGTRVRFVAR